MKLYRWPTGFTVAAGRHRWDYWRPGCWAPLSVRGRLRCWGALTHSKVPW